MHFSIMLLCCAGETIRSLTKSSFTLLHNNHFLFKQTLHTTIYLTFYAGRSKTNVNAEQCKFCGKMFLKDNIDKHIHLRHYWLRIERKVKMPHMNYSCNNQVHN